MKKDDILSIAFFKSKLQRLFLFLVKYLKSSTTFNLRRRESQRFKTIIVVPILSVIIFSLIKILLELLVNQQRPLVYTGAVIFSAWYGGVWAGVFATFLSSFFIDFFFLKPYYSILHRSVVQSLELLIFFGFGLSISILIETMYSAVRGERESSRLITHILESITDAFINFDKNFRVIYINSSAAKIVKITKRKNNQLIGKTVAEVFNPEMANFIQYKGRQAIKDKEHQEEEFFCTRTKHWYDIDFYPTKNGVTVYIADISNRKKDEEVIKRTESRLKRLIDSNIIGVAIEDIRGKVLESNDVFLKMIGYSRSDLPKLNWTKITSLGSRTTDKEAMKTLFEKGEVSPYEKEYIRKDGSKVPVLKGGAILDKNPPRAVVFVIDISEQKKLEQRKDEFISIASHELKTPLTSIKAFTQLLQRHTELTNDKKAINYLSHMEGQLSRLTKLVVDLLDVSKIQEGKLLLNKEIFDFDQLADEMIEEIQTANTGYKILRQGTSNVKVLADKFRISQVITNLLNNAIKYSAGNREIVVKVSSNNNDAFLSVHDFGIGITIDNQSEIFKKFYRVDSKRNQSYPGLGLGLYISAEIINRHHGKIWVESVLDKGSIFTISLPVINHG